MSAKKQLLILLLLPFFSGLSWSQNFNFQFDCDWVEEDNRCFPCAYDGFTGEIFSNTTKQIKLRGKFDFSYEVESLVYEKIDFPSHYDKSVLPNATNVEISFGTTQNENYITAKYNPIVYRGGNVEILKTIKVSVSGAMLPGKQDRDAEFASVSVLASGDWYKIGVQSEGIYTLNYSDLSELGIAVNSINPKSINIYGNHIPEISHNNSDYRPDDLIKNSIVIVGEDDLSFDSEDYIMFYAKGTENLIANSSDFNASRNKIDSLAYFFIHIDNSDAPKRIGNIENSTAPFTNDISSFSAYTLHELNEENLLKSGDRWYGEYFQGSQLTKSIIINSENRVITEPVHLKTQLVSESRSGVSQLKIDINGLHVDTIVAENFGGAYTAATVKKSESTFSSATENFNIQLTFERTSPASEGWLDYMLFNYVKNLRMGVNPLVVRDVKSDGLGNVNRYTISNANSATLVWEVTDPYNTKKVSGTLTGSNYAFIHETDTVRTYVAFNKNQCKSPVLNGTYLGKIANQNLHGFAQADYLILTHESLRPQADRLASLHRNKGLTVYVVDIQLVYNEFGGGAADPVAVRWIAKMFYDRAAVDPEFLFFNYFLYDPI